MKIFLGTIEISNFQKNYARSLKNIGYEVFTSSSYIKNGFYEDDFDLNFSRFGEFLAKKNIIPNYLIIIKLFNILFNRFPFLFRYYVEKYIINQFDAFIFFWGLKSMLPNFKDLEIIKKKNKRIIYCIMGSDLRHPLAFQQFYNIDSTEPWQDSLIKIKLKQKLLPLRQIENFADVIFSVPDQSLLSVRPYNHLRVIVEPKTIQFNPKKFNSDELVISHFPSRSRTKGTSIVLTVIEELRKTGLKFKFQFRSGIPHQELLKLLNKTHILIDELNGLGPGMLGYEAMASGCILLTNTDDKSIIQTPAIRTNKFNLKQNLVDLIKSDRNLLSNMSLDSKKFVEDEFTTDVAGKYFSKAIDGSLKPDYYPIFLSKGFRNTFNEKIPKNLKILTEKVIKQNGYHSKKAYSDLLEKKMVLKESLEFQEWVEPTTLI